MHSFTVVNDIFFWRFQSGQSSFADELGVLTETGQKRYVSSTIAQQFEGEEDQMQVETVEDVAYIFHGQLHHVAELDRNEALADFTTQTLCA